MTLLNCPDFLWAPIDVLRENEMRSTHGWARLGGVMVERERHFC